MSITGEDLPSSPAIFRRLGARPVINACGVYTDLGGSILSPTVWAAMEEANRSFVGMAELLETTGRRVAELVGAEAARVTPGASAAIALGTAACMTGMDGNAWERLPDTTDLMKTEAVLQHSHRYKYDRCARLAGARLVDAGDADGTSVKQLRAALGPRTAMVLFAAHLEDKRGTVGLKDTLAIAGQQNVPTLVDAAYSNFPTHRMGTFTASGADLVCFSAKYFGGPNGGGFLCGRRHLIDAVAGVDFVGFESGHYRTFGRAFKLDRQIVVGTVVALEEWLTMDHDARWVGYAKQARELAQRLEGVSGIESQPRYFTMDERLLEEPVNCLAIRPRPHGRNAQQLADVLAAGEPSIAIAVLDNTLIVVLDCLVKGQEEALAKRLRQELQR